MTTSVPPSSSDADSFQRSQATPPPYQTGRGKRRSPQIQLQSLRFRLLLVWGILIAGSASLGLHLFHLQILQGAELQAKARQQQMIYLRPFVPRRPIVDRGGNVLAIDQPAYILYAHPKLFKQSKDAIAEQLAPILSKPAGKIVRQFNRADSGIQMEYSLSEDAADRIADLSLDGLELIQHQERLYPQQDLFANVVGYVNVDRQGQAGVEYSQQKLLERAVQTVRLSRTGSGALIPDQVPGGFLHVDDLRLQLTLDSRLQRAARFALQQQVKQYQAKRGTVMVMDARDGAILAMVSEPSYDPNQYYKFDVELFKNWALSDLYEPGSTFKPLTVAIALETGAVTPNSVFNDEGQIYVDNWPISNHDFDSVGGRGPLTLAQILQYSSNIGMVHIAQQMPAATYYSWLEKLGLGQRIGIDLPSEVAGQLKSRSQFLGSPVEAATTAFGQGFTLTPIQLLQLQGTLANGGQLVTPYLVRGLFDTNGQVHWQPNRAKPRQVFSPQTTRTVLNMMETVVTQGTGRVAQIPGYRIAGKTGTAQKANPQGGYYDRAKITSFVGILPVEAPRYVVLAVIDEPQGDDAFGSTVAAPIVKSVMEALITIERIPPSQPSAPPSAAEPPASEAEANPTPPFNRQTTP